MREVIFFLLKKVKLGTHKLCLTHNLYANVALNMCDKPILLKTFFAHGSFATHVFWNFNSTFEPFFFAKTQVQFFRRFFSSSITNVKPIWDLPPSSTINFPLSLIDFITPSLGALGWTKINQQNRPKKVHLGDFLHYLTIKHNNMGYYS